MDRSAIFLLVKKINFCLLKFISIYKFFTLKLKQLKKIHKVNCELKTE